MTNQQILEQAIQKAIDGGWNWEDNPMIAWNATKDQAAHSITTNMEEFYGTIEEMYSIESLIFNHDFAKALWGDKEHGTDGAKWGTADNCTRCGMIDHEYSTLYCWQYHLQQMVIADDPVKYLGDNI